MQRSILIGGAVAGVVGIVWYAMDPLGNQGSPDVDLKAIAAQQARQRQADKQEMAEYRRKKQEQIDWKLEAAAAEEAKVDQMLNGHLDQQWTILPDWVSSVRIDERHRTWILREPVLDTQENRQRSMAGPAEGRTHVVRDEEFLAQDAKGRLYFRDIPLHKIHIYDHGIWSEQPLAFGAAADVLKTSSIMQVFQDRAGNLWFLVEPGSVLCRRAADDRWESYVIEGLPAGTLLDDWHFAEQADGRIIAHPAPARSPDARNTYIAHFDGKAWKAGTLAGISDPSASIHQIVPLANGALALHLDGDFELFWPDPSLLDDTEIQRLIKQLDDIDPVARDEASWHLAQYGSVVQTRLEAALQRPQLTPEAQARIGEILARLEQRKAGKPDSSRLVANRYKLGYVYEPGGTNGKEARFIATDVEDVVAKKEYPTCVVSIAGDGILRVIPSATTLNWSRQGDQGVPFVDSKGRLWMTHSLLVQPDGSIASATPPGLVINKICGETADGKIIGRAGGHYVIYDESAKASATLATTTYQQSVMGYDRLTSRLWLYDKDRGLGMFSKGDWTPVKLPADTGSLCRIVPLRNQGMLIMSDNGVFDPESGANKWRIYQFVKDKPQQWAKRLPAYADDGTSFLVGSDGESMIWVRGVEDDQIGQMGYQSLYCFDGQKWHNVSDELKWAKDQSDDARPADGGKALIRIGKSVLSKVDGIVTSTAPLELIRVEHGTITSTCLRTLSDSSRIDLSRAKASGKFLFMPAVQHDGKACVYHDGQLEELPFAGIPRLSDSRGQMWFAQDDGTMAYVWSNGKSLQGQIPTKSGGHAMVEDSSGRIWLLHAEGISQLKVQDGKLVEASRINWSAPRTSFGVILTDDCNGLWDMSNTLGPVRYELPKDGQ